MSDKPAQQNPERPEFWDQRFFQSVTPWEASDVPADFDAFLISEAGNNQGRRALIPGCGSAREAARLTQYDWQTTALDFSQAAIDKARALLGVDWPGKLLCADFFAFDAGPGFDLIYERAFLCALPRCRWESYADRMAALIPSGGRLVGYFFHDETLKGPPFGILPAQLDALLTPAFHCLLDRPVHDSQPIFAGRERWQIWQRC